MRIVIVETVLDSSIIGGGSIYLPGLIQGLVNRGHEVHLVLKGEPNPKIEKLINNSGATIHIKPWKKKGLATDIAVKMAAWINKLKPQVYVVSASYDIGWLVLPLLNPGIATFAIAHSDANNFYFPIKHYRNFITFGIGVSEEICRKFEEISQLKGSRIKWIPYGIKPAETIEQRPLQQTLKIVYAGRMEEFQKRISDVKEIIKRLGGDKTDYHFKLIGDGTGYKPIKEELYHEIENGNLEMPGWLSGDKVLEAFLQSDIFILTSSSEGFSISLIEAMANGCCPVVTAIPSGSLQLIENGKNGFLIRVGDIGDFIKKLKFLSQHRDRLEEMRKAAWHTGKNYSVDRMVESYIKCFEQGIQSELSFPRKKNEEFPPMASCRSKYPDWIRRIKMYVLNESGFVEE